jgi:ferredoxin
MRYQSTGTIASINNKIKDKVAITPKSFNFFFRVLRFLVASAPYFRKPVIGKLLKALTLMDRPDKNHTQAYVISLNEDLTNGSENVVLPIDIMRRAVRESSYRAIMHRCICRAGKDCAEYPINLGCIFIGEGSRVSEERGIAREATVEEALAHIDRAAKAGLVGQCLWLEAEQYFWGVRNENMHQFLEICFCCPCCCSALLFYPHTSPDVQKRFRHVGWNARINELCNHCGICKEICPAHAISLNEGKPSVSDLCLGCGLCASKCPESAVDIVQISPTKSDIREYFTDFKLDV